MPHQDVPANTTESNSYYLRYCREHGLEPHPARYPAELPEYFIRMLTDPGDLVLDPFGGSCVTGEVCERLRRQWVCVELNEEYLQGALARFEAAPDLPLLGDNGQGTKTVRKSQKSNGKSKSYELPRPGALWDQLPESPLSADGGRKRIVNGAKGDRQDDDEESEAHEADAPAKEQPGEEADFSSSPQQLDLYSD